MPPKLTPAELKLEKARIKAEKELAKREAEKIERRAFLARELNYGEQSWRVIEKKFKDFATKIRIPQLKEQVEASWRYFEHAVDCKNLIISRLLDELEGLEEDHCVVQQKHIVASDEIMQIFKTRIEELHKNFEIRKADILEENKKLLAELEDELIKEKDGYELSMLLMKEKNEETLKALNAFKFFTENEEKNDAALSLVNLNERVKEDMDDLWAQIKAILKLYLDSTKEPKEEYDILKKKDMNARKTLETRLQKTKKLHDEIRKLKDKLVLIQDLSEVTLMKLYDERQYFDRLFKSLCKRMRDEKDMDHNQLIALATASSNTIKWLQSKAKKGECILKLAQACQELETQEEKVMPFRYCYHDSEAEDEYDEYDKTAKNIVGPKIWNGVHGLENFCQKVSDVELKYANMLRASELLLRENQYLGDFVQQRIKALAQCHKELLH